ncbi:MAG: site-specific integrase [Planctomycetota bacterium]
MKKDNPNYNHFAFIFYYGGVRCLKQKEKLVLINFHLPIIQPDNTAKRLKEKCITLGTIKNRRWNGILNRQHFLHNGKAKMFETTKGNMTLKSLCNIYLQHQQVKAASAEITVRHYADQVSCLKKFMSFIGQHRKINEISTLDLQNYKRKLKRAYNSAHRINLHISIMKAVFFHWARKNDILDYIPNIDAVSSVKIIH